MKYFGGCDVGSTYTKAVILDETGKIVADTTIRSKINSEVSAKLAMEEVEEEFGFPVYAVVDVYDIIEYLEGKPEMAENVARIKAYLAVNGGKA